MCDERIDVNARSFGLDEANEFSHTASFGISINAEVRIDLALPILSNNGEASAYRSPLEERLEHRVERVLLDSLNVGEFVQPLNIYSTDCIVPYSTEQGRSKSVFLSGKEYVAAGC